jgi:transcriptional regulator NrdR family protein
MARRHVRPERLAQLIVKCPRCAAWSRVLDTRTADDGYTLHRRHECANLHRFRSVQVLSTVYCSAKQRNTRAIVAAKRRADLAARNAAIRRDLAAGRRGVDIAAELGVSKSLVSLVARGLTL